MKWTLLLYIILGLGVVIFLILQHPVFGKSPSGERLKRLKQSRNYQNGEFRNLSPTPQLTEGATMPKLIYQMFVGKRPERLEPEMEIPSVKTNLHQLPDRSLVWLGHSSYIFKAADKVFVVDPVLSGSASPIPGSMKAFPGSDAYSAGDLPEIDYLILSHDHYDHLDYRTLKELIPQVKQVICGLGVGAHLEHWGYDPALIIEMDWWDAQNLSDQLHITATPARHFSGRAIRRNQTLWCSYVLNAGDLRLFIGGDSGYDTHFREIGEKFGPFDLAILENGQYNRYWKHIHTLPAELSDVQRDLRAKAVLPVHSAKFALALHDWDEPLRLAVKNARAARQIIFTPKIGEVVLFTDTSRQYQEWWKTATP